MVDNSVANGTEIAHKVIDNVSQVILRKTSVIELGLTALIAGGHALVEDVPGVGKTMLAKSLAISTGCSFKLIQFTPDLLPRDITGVSVYSQQSGEFHFRQGPIMAQVVLADEINRATPKTQSALLEAMEEQQVSVDGVTHPTPRPFYVIGTQNPIEHEGTFQLPEAQLDRFLLRISLGYPGFTEELSIIERQEVVHPIENLKPVTTSKEMMLLQDAAKHIYVDLMAREYIVSLVEATRKYPEVALGASPRASIDLFKVARALALIKGRDYVIPDDVKDVAVEVLAHRVIASSAARMRGNDWNQIVVNVLNSIPVPGTQSKSRSSKKSS